MQRVFCFGVGFSGLEILQHAKKQGFAVIGCVRCPNKAKVLSARTHIPIIPFHTVDIRRINPTHIINTVPTNGKIQGASDAPYDAYAPHIKKLPHLQWLGYVSTTGVYGNTHGDWVDETTAVNPSGKRGKSRLAVEKLWVDLHPKTHIFRLPGIYGRGRSALDRVQHPHAHAIHKPNQYFSRIHIYDIAQTVVASMHAPNPHSIYNVVDDMPCDGVQVLQFACDLLHRPMVPIIPYARADLSPMAHSFYRDSRRVKNHKIKTELGVKLQYPNYKRGLKAIFQQKPLENTC